MQVSNSTEQSTDYRVGANGGGSASEGIGNTSLNGRLKPRGNAKLSPPKGNKSWFVEFYVRKQLVASLTCFKTPGTLTLVRDDWGYWIKRDLAA